MNTANTLCALVSVGFLTTTASAQSSRHALDPLSGGEITSAVSILKSSGNVTPQARFGTISVQPQAKTAPAAARAARIVGFDWSNNRAFVAVVNLATNRVESWAVVDSEPPMRLLSIRRAEEAAHNDPRWVAAMRARGIDTARVNVLVSLPERAKLPRTGTDRTVGVSNWYRDGGAQSSGVDGIGMRVNLTQARVIEFNDAGGKPAARNTDPSDGPLASRRPLSPLRIEQPQGSAARITGNAIAWDNWTLRVGVDPRRGIEIHDVAFTDGNRRRSVLYSGSITEIVAPYGSPSFATWYPRDEGDYGMGIYSMSSTVENNDAPSNAAFINATMHDHEGRPIAVPRAIAVYERDGGMLWRHANQSRRGRQLVVSGHSTIDNYDYQFSWIFSQDGSIEAEVVLSGIMNVGGSPNTRDTSRAGGHTHFSHLVAPNVFAPNHQHFFGYRLDFDVDGTQNTAYQLDTRAPARGTDNPKGEWFGMSEVPLTSERGAIADVSFATARSWRIANTHERNALGQFTSYALVPGAAAPAFPLPESAPMRMSGFIAHQVWVTPNSPDELYAGGEFQNLGRDNEGLPAWTRADRPLADKDVVLWYTLGVTHIPRPEDWPIMPAHRASFKLIPASFFARNPAMEIPANR
ncbi:MAG TPA: hypothetical protein VJR92_07935 [Gemmatimonadaceae bacterium]|nr:hypothetical protein [Gemmatimonadaceae bacterium]